VQGEQTAEQAGDEQVAESHRRRPQDRRLKPGQPTGGMGRDQRAVGTLQQVGGHERGIGQRHRDDPHRQPACWRHGGDQRAQRHARKARQRQSRGLPGEGTAVCPRQGEQRSDAQRQRQARASHQTPERERCQRRHGHQRQVGERLRAALRGQTADDDEDDHRRRRHDRPQTAVQAMQRSRRRCSR